MVAAATSGSRNRAGMRPMTSIDAARRASRVVVLRSGCTSVSPIGTAASSTASEKRCQAGRAEPRTAARTRSRPSLASSEGWRLKEPIADPPGRAVRSDAHGGDGGEQQRRRCHRQAQLRTPSIRTRMRQKSARASMPPPAIMACRAASSGASLRYRLASPSPTNANAVTTASRSKAPLRRLPALLPGTPPLAVAGCGRALRGSADQHLGPAAPLARGGRTGADENRWAGRDRRSPGDSEHGRGCLWQWDHADRRSLLLRLARSPPIPPGPSRRRLYSGPQSGSTHVKFAGRPTATSRTSTRMVQGVPGVHRSSARRSTAAHAPRLRRSGRRTSGTPSGSDATERRIRNAPRPGASGRRRRCRRVGRRPRAARS